MSEREIRSVLEQICNELKRRACSGVRKVVVPAAVGVGLTLASCSGGEGTNDAVAADAVADVKDDAAQDMDTPAVPLYAAPDDVPARPAYAAPDDLGPQPLYAAPDDVVDPDDVPIRPLYAAPDDVPVQPLYAAPDDVVDPDDIPVQPLYAAPDDVVDPDDIPVQPLYAAVMDVGPAKDTGSDAEKPDIQIVPLYGVPFPEKDAS